jgi:hypothetical protein
VQEANDKIEQVKGHIRAQTKWAWELS